MVKHQVPVVAISTGSVCARISVEDISHIFNFNQSAALMHVNFAVGGYYFLEALDGGQK